MPAPGQMQRSEAAAAVEQPPAPARCRAVLRRFRAPGRRGFQEPAQCAICFEGFRRLEEAAALPCSLYSSCASVFHRQCATSWLHKEGSCPLCRRHFPGLGPVQQPAASTAATPASVRASFVLFEAGSFVPGSHTLLPGQREAWLPVDELFREFLQDHHGTEQDSSASTSRGSSPVRAEALPPGPVARQRSLSFGACAPRPHSQQSAASPGLAGRRRRGSAASTPSRGAGGSSSVPSLALPRSPAASGGGRGSAAAPKAFAMEPRPPAWEGRHWGGPRTASLLQQLRAAKA